MTEASLCECGCGEPAPIVQRSDASRGYVKGEHHRFRSGHWAKSKRQPDYQIEDRGYETPCWVWAKVLNRGGYGQTYLSGVRGARLAHRAYYERAFGAIPDGLELDHLCRTRACVNPDHLEPVTRAQNVRRGLNARLTEADVRRIHSSDASHATLAERFGVHKSTIQDIRTRRSWREVTA